MTLVSIESAYATSDLSVIVTLVLSRYYSHSTLILRVFPLQQIPHAGVGPNRSLKLISREIILEVDVDHT